MTYSFLRWFFYRTRIKFSIAGNRCPSVQSQWYFIARTKLEEIKNGVDREALHLMIGQRWKAAFAAFNCDLDKGARIGFGLWIPRNMDKI